MKEASLFVPPELRFYLDSCFIDSLKLPACCIKQLARFLDSGVAGSTSKQSQVHFSQPLQNLKLPAV